MDRQALSRRIEDLRNRCHNLTPQDIERLATDAGWVFDRFGKNHAIYIKPGFWANLSIPQNLKGWTARRLLNIIESSLYEEGIEE